MKSRISVSIMASAVVATSLVMSPIAAAGAAAPILDEHTTTTTTLDVETVLEGTNEEHRQLSSPNFPSYPWQISLQRSRTQICSASLIAPFALLTSASCVGKFDAVYSPATRSYFTASGIQTVVHPRYNSNTAENDYAVLLLPGMIDNVVPVELNRFAEVLPHSLTLPNWGGDSLLYIENEQCSKYSGFYSSPYNHDVSVLESYGGRIKESMMCAASNEIIPQQFCQANVGGALIVKGSAHEVLFGSVSWGVCNSHHFPGVYSRITPSALQFIDSTVCNSPMVLHRGPSESGVPASFYCSSNSVAQNRASLVALQVQSQFQTLRQSWPHSLKLTLTFDARPTDISWKFENARTKAVLAGVAFDKYDDATFGNRTVEVPIDILTSEDFEGEDESYFEMNKGESPFVREYRFVIYDRGGNGMCCENGNGKYELYSKGTLIASGSTFGAIESTEFTIDPRIFLGANWDGGVVDNIPVINIPSINIPGGSLPSAILPTVGIPTANRPTVSIPTAIIPPPAPPSPTASGINSPATPVDNSAPTLNAPTEPVYDIPNTPSVVASNPVEPTGPAKPTYIASFYCGTSFDDAEENCHLPCPSGSPAECADKKLNFLEVEYVCYADTTCRERTVVPSPPTSKPIAMNKPNAPTTPAAPTPPTNDYIDANTWFCGESWNWVKDNCEKAKPCPGGDAVDCPANHICIASTPCTLVPTSTPSEVPSSMPTEEPTPSPTKSPWSEAAFVDFLNSPSDLEPTNEGQPTSPSESSPASDKDPNLASEVNQALENYNELQYHFFCGISWTHADETCGEFCPSGDKKECPDGKECYANTRCDGRDTPPPTISPAPTAKKEDVGATPTSGEVCSVCEDKAVDTTKVIPFQGGSTCGNLDQTMRAGNILVGSNSCNGMRDMYRNSCCYDKCHLCQRANDNVLDMRDEHIVKQGGYTASCQEINNILSKSDQRDSVCKDAQSQLSEECCYDQCSLCGGADMSTEWYATVTYQGLTTTCLGVDYLLRAEQVMDGSDRCSNLQGQYMDRCCYRADSCQLCRADNNLYDVDPSKIVTVERSTVRSTSMSCKEFSDSLATATKDSQECKNGRQAYFGQCCDLSSLIVSSGGTTPTSPVEVGGTPVSPPSPEEVANPSPTNSTQNNSTGSVGQPAPSPSDPLDWGEEPSDFSWEKDWKPLGSSGYLSAAVSSFVVLGLAAFTLLFV